VSLIKQWEREAKTKIKPGRHALAVLNAHDPANKTRSYPYFQRFDLVLTTYDKLSREAAKFDEYVKSQASAGKPVDDDHVLRSYPFVGPKSMFHRVILDESQAVKNPKSLRFKAISRIQATHRWCLTGTPMMNGVEELAPLISFLRVAPYNELESFKATFGSLSLRNPKGATLSEKRTALKKLQALLKAIMLRRTKQSKIDGRAIIQLKPKTEMIDHVTLSGEEAEFYEALEKDSAAKVNRFLRQGLAGKRYHIALVLLLRLRQACCHPFLLMNDLEFVNNEIPSKNMLMSAGKLEEGVVQRILGHIYDKEPFECPICYDPTEQPCLFLCGHYACTECLAKMRTTVEAENVRAGNEGAKTSCPECRVVIDLTTYITYDVFKQVHMKEQENVEHSRAKAANTSEQYFDRLENDEFEFKLKKTVDNELDEGSRLRDYVMADDQNTDLALVGNDQAARTKGQNGFQLGQQHEEKDKASCSSDLAKLRQGTGKARARYIKHLRHMWQDSAKITKCAKLISDIQATGEKTIVFSQWTMLLDLLEVKLSADSRSLGFRRYDGSMSSIQRDAAVTDFTNDPDCKVMLISLKAGNAGLNLTMASHVIIMDPFWNPFIESQAIDRAYRIGQTREVKVHRILTKETVEDRIIELAAAKRDLVNSALDENASNAIGRLSVKDLAYLFGIGERT
jgi:SNF2 family DNA or RNA helicase